MISFTKVQVPIFFKMNPSDFEGYTSYVDIACDSFSQNTCYIGEQKIEEFSITRIQRADCKTNSAPQWMVDLIILTLKTEDEVICLLHTLCEILSFHCACQFSCIQNGGLYGFTFYAMSVKRWYSTGERIFSDVDFNYRCGTVEIKTTCTLQANIFELATEQMEQTQLQKNLNNAFLVALKSADPVARYLLLYYLFEIMYATPEYKALKEQYEEAQKALNKKPSSDKKRSEILCQYLHHQFALNSYCSFGKDISLDSDILYEIIKTRNDLTHRADRTNINEKMYSHMIPILGSVKSYAQN